MVCLDTAYFVETKNNFKKKLLFTLKVLCITLMHYSWDMNSARGTGEKKKRRKTQTAAFSSVSKPTLSLSVFDDLKIKILFPLGV